MKKVILTTAALVGGVLLSACQSPDVALAEAASYAAAGNHAAAFPLYRQAADRIIPITRNIDENMTKIMEVLTT